MGQRSVLTAIAYCSIGLVTAVGGFAQDVPPFLAPQQDQQPHAWRRAGDAAPDQPAPDQALQPQPDQSQAPQAQIAQQGPDQGPPPPPNFSANQGYGQPQQAPPAANGQQPMAPAPQPMNRQPAYGNYMPPPPPAQLNLRPGTYVTVRVNQWLSSDRNKEGDTFLGSLADPVIVDGIIVAQRGQTVYGRVTEAQKAGRVEGTSKLGVELTSLTLVDGQQLAIHSQMVTKNGTTSNGRDAAAIGGTTALGAVVGAGADWGRGAAIGAGAGAVVGIVGVLLTRGHPTVIYPETALTFQIASPATISTTGAPQAFRPVGTQQPNYSRNGYSQQAPPPQRAGGAPYYTGGAYGGAVAPPPQPYYYGPAYNPYYWGPGLSVYYGPGFYGGGFYYRGFRR